MNFRGISDKNHFEKPDLYTQETWDEIYKSKEILPWTKKGWTEKSIECISPYINSNDKKILDYGCGSGEISKYLYANGHNVTAVDISDEAVKLLKSKNFNLNVIRASHPKEIWDANYNCIISTGVFHHINPKFWESFIEDFSKKLLPNGKLIIAGWDKSDPEFIETPKRISKVTKNKTWYINDLGNDINHILTKNGLALDDTKLISFIEPGYNKERLIRCFLFRKLFKYI